MTKAGGGLFQPLSVGPITVQNRVMVSPMCTYSATEGLANDFHLVHLGRFALGGAGVVIVEATAVQAAGRISHHDLGLWTDAQADALARVARFIGTYGAVAGIQLSHAGRKGSARAAWEGGGPLLDEDAARGESPWETVAPSAVPAGPGWPDPRELSDAEIAQTVQDWARSARRAVEAGFSVVELHGAHGYLLHQFLSPVSNRRTGTYGGSEESRKRLPLEVVAAVREAIGDRAALFYRVSVIDGVKGGLGVEETVAFAEELRLAGVDLVDVSSGGLSTDRAVDTRVPRRFGYHAPYARELRDRAGVAVAAAGLVVDPRQASAQLADGDVDLVVLGREMLEDPAWAHHARRALGGSDYDAWHVQAAAALAARAATIETLRAQGDSPLATKVHPVGISGREDRPRT